MKTGALEIVWADEKLCLLPERAVWWAREKTLFIADPHFGKASAFRFAGIAVPETSHDDDLARLEKIVRRHAARRLVILGDFFHAKSGRSESTLAALKNWRERQGNLEIILIIGNHDRHAGCPPDEWKIECVKEPWLLAPFHCRHKPPEKFARDLRCAAMCIRRSAFMNAAASAHPASVLFRQADGHSARVWKFYRQASHQARRG